MHIIQLLIPDLINSQEAILSTKFYFQQKSVLKAAFKDFSFTNANKTLTHTTLYFNPNLSLKLLFNAFINHPQIVQMLKILQLRNRI